MTQANLRVIKELFVSRFDRSQVVSLVKAKITYRKPLTDEGASHLAAFSRYFDGVLDGIYADLGLTPSGDERRQVVESLKEEILDAYRLAKKGVMKLPVA